MCLRFILTRGLLWFLPEQSRTNGRDTRVPEALQCKQLELANTPMKTELYLGLDVDKEWIVIAVAEWDRKGAVQDLERSAMICMHWESCSRACASATGLK